MVGVPRAWGDVLLKSDASTVSKHLFVMEIWNLHIVSSAASKRPGLSGSAGCCFCKGGCPWSI